MEIVMDRMQTNRCAKSHRPRRCANNLEVSIPFCVLSIATALRSPKGQKAGNKVAAKEAHVLCSTCPIWKKALNVL